MLQLDPKTISELEASGTQKLKVFFYSAGCSGTKINMQTEFEVTEDLVLLNQKPLSNPPLLGEGIDSSEKGNVASSLLAGENGERYYSFDLYVPKTDKEHLENARITKTVKADHTGQAKVRYIFTSEEVEERCGCGTSFAFDKPAPKVDLAKLQLLRVNFKNKNS